MDDFISKGFIEKFAKMITLYHGTSYKNAKKILKNDLSELNMGRVWTERLALKAEYFYQQIESTLRLIQNCLRMLTKGFLKRFLILIKERALLKVVLNDEDKKLKKYYDVGGFDEWHYFGKIPPSKISLAN